MNFDPERLGQLPETLLAIAEAASARIDAASLLSAVQPVLQRVISFDRLNVVLIDPIHGTSEARFTAGIEGSTELASNETWTQAVVNAVVSHPEGVFALEPIASDSAAAPAVPPSQDHSLLAIPLIHGGRTAGVLCFEAQKAALYSARDLPLARAIATQLAPLIEGLLFREEVERSTLARDALNQLAPAVRRSRLFQGIQRSAVSRSLVGQILRDIQAAGHVSEGAMFRAGLALPSRLTDTSVERFLDSFAEMGLGALFLVERDETRNRWVFHGDKLVELQSGHPDPTCHYTRGYLCGILSRIHPLNDFVAAETGCQSLGDAFCRFVAQGIDLPPR